MTGKPSVSVGTNCLLFLVACRPCGDPDPSGHERCCFPRRHPVQCHPWYILTVWWSASRGTSICRQNQCSDRPSFVNAGMPPFVLDVGSCLTWSGRPASEKNGVFFL